MIITLEVDGKQYGGFTEADVTIRLDALSNTFSFVATAEGAVVLPFNVGQSCKAIVDGEQVLSGYIELININGSATNHEIAIQGRDKTSDVIDSSIGSMSDLKSPISLKRIIDEVITHIGSSVFVIDEVHPTLELFLRREDLASPEIGENAFEFIDKMARKKFVVLTSDGDGNIVITRATGSSINASITNVVDGKNNNVLQYSVSHDSSGRFNLYVSQSQYNLMPAAGIGVLTVDEIVSQDGRIIDSRVRSGRQLVLVNESMFSSGSNEDRITWERNVRRARGSIYSPTVDGFRNQTGDLWRINTVLLVNDEFAGINKQMLVNSVTYSMTRQAGNVSKLSFIEKEAYSLNREEPEEEDPYGGFG